MKELKKYNQGSSVVRYRDGGLTRIVSMDRMLSLFERFGAEGMTCEEIGLRLNGVKGSANYLMRKHPILKAAYQRGIDGRTIDAEAMLLKRALGFSVPSKKVVTKEVDGVIVEQVTTEEDIYFPPDVSAIRTFVRGREAQRYSGDDDGKGAVTINITGRAADL